MIEDEKIKCPGECNSCEYCPPETIDAQACDCGEDDCNCDMADGVLTFVDENGKDVDFQVLDTVLADGKEYLVVLPLDKKNLEAKEQEVIILEIKEEDGEEVYDTVVDEAEGEKVFEIFQKQCDEAEEE